MRLRLGLFGFRGRFIVRLLHVTIFILIGLPLIIFITGELLIHLNEWVVGEKASYSFDIDPVEWQTNHTLEIPGPKYGAAEKAPSPKNHDAFDRYLLETYAPVVVQKLGHHPAYDIPVDIAFDGNDDPRDNVANENRFRPMIPDLHAEVTGETEDSYYLLYCFYHIKDYDHPVREMMSNWTFHDNDDEGIMFRLDKATMRITEAEGWFHNRFFLANVTGRAEGSEPLQGKLYFESETHPLVYSQSMGHGVRCFQKDDLETLDTNVKILRYSKTPTGIGVNRKVEADGTYGIKSFDRWYDFALGPFGKEGKGSGMFEETITIGKAPDGKKIQIGRFIAGIDYAKLSWSRPKPPWSWDDGWDKVPIFVWHFFPSRAFNSHFGLSLSDDYLRNRPVEKTFHMEPEALYARLSVKNAHRRDSKWGNFEKLERSPNRKQYFEVFQKILKRYVNRLFNALG